jgi:1-acyl-sn-glycerol-3-phosphate acyltransferase
MNTQVLKERTCRVLYRVLWSTARVLAKLYWRIEIIGTERVPTAGAFVIAPVHRSNLDFLIAAMAVDRQVRFMAKSSIFLGGIVSRALRALGAFPVRREGVDRDAIEQCERSLAAGVPVVVFPEGRRKEGPVVEAILDGPAFCATRQRVPILPMGIGGSDRAMPIGSKMILPRKVVVIIGEPIYPDVELTGRVPRSAVTSTSGLLREQVQMLYTQAQRRATGE